ncbi:MAG: hypothetical protein Q8P67_03615 [archaeon]|nr:hypothetical protein [archaeon]
MITPKSVTAIIPSSPPDVIIRHHDQPSICRFELQRNEGLPFPAGCHPSSSP